MGPEHAPPLPFPEHCFNRAGDRSPDVTVGFSPTVSRIVSLQWGRESLPGCDGLSGKASTALTGFNGAEDCAPDVTSSVRRILFSCCRFNGAGGYPRMRQQLESAGKVIAIASMGPGISPRM